MSGFSEAWLALREPADRAARSMSLTGEVARRLANTSPQPSARDPLRIVDLGTGAGANPRFLAEHLPPFQAWTLVDGDARLLAALRTHTAAWATRAGWATVQSRSGIVVAGESMEYRFTPVRADLADPRAAGLTGHPALVTASALLDLVSGRWLEDLVAACREQRATVLFALTYDGRATLSPAHEDDLLVLELVNRHQRTDKGFGEALGPAAAARAAVEFDASGYVVLRARSDWQLGPDDRTLIEELIGGWVAAARDMAPGASARLAAWERERRAQAAAGQLSVMVGHEDLAGWPA